MSPYQILSVCPRWLYSSILFELNLTSTSWHNYSAGAMKLTMKPDEIGNEILHKKLVVVVDFVHASFVSQTISIIIV